MRTLAPMILLCVSLLTNTLISQSLYINEFLASNTSIVTDEFGGYDDWVEIYNAGPAPVDLGGMFVTDDLSQPNKWQIPPTAPDQTTIPAGGFLLIWFDGEPAQGPLHVNPKLGAGGEDIGIFSANGTQIDALTFGPQTANVSFGRLPDGGSSFQFFNSPTPGAANGLTNNGQADRPKASVGGGFYQSPFEVELSAIEPQAEIRYTLDGSEPTDGSELYTGPLVIQQTTTLRAKAFAIGMLPSQTATFSYLFEVPHTFPVVALSFNDADFFDPATGIYTNFEQDWERPVHLELYETNGQLAFSQEATAEIQGTGSASLPQKSLQIKALPGIGGGQFGHAIFPNLPFDQYQRLVLRNSGQDWNITMFRDAFVSSLAGDLGDVGSIILPPRLFLQGFRPGVAYLNGEYWGIHNLREHVKANYIQQHFGLSANEIDLLDNDEVDEGNSENWDDLKVFLQTSDLTDHGKLAEMAQMVDLPHFLDYNVFNIIIDNSDWPGNNYRRWRARNNGPWRFLTFDLDFSFGLFNLVPGGPTWNTGDASANSLARSLDDAHTNFPNPFWNTLYFRKPMENEHFRRDFINRTADFLNVLFHPDRVVERINQFEALYQPEIQRHFDRWNTGVNPFPDNVEKLRQFAKDRPGFVRQHIVEAFPDVTGTANVTLQVDPPGAGSISFSTLEIGDAHLPSTGRYFAGIDIPVTAVPATGYSFAGWSGANVGTGISTTINLSGDVVLTAHFSIGNSNPQPQSIDFPTIPDKFTNDQPFTVTATATSGLPVEFSIVSGPATVQGNVITLTGSLGLVFVQATQPGNGQWLAAAPVTKVFRVIAPVVSPPVEYCKARGEQPWLEWIARVTFADLDNASSKRQYSDFTGLSANVGLGEMVGLTVEPGFSWQIFDNEHVRAWIDFNQDLDFDDPGELVMEASGDRKFHGIVQVPTTAQTGTTRLRIAMQRGGYPLPCDTFLQGEVEDYSLQIGLSVLLPQAIDFQALSNLVSGTLPFQLMATATSGLPVSFSVASGPAILNGNMLTLTGLPGTVTIVANQWGNAQWQAAFPVAQSFEVVTAPPPPPSYCTSSGDRPWLEWIERVEFGSLDHFSHKERYGDFTQISAGANLGEVVRLRVSPRYSWDVYEEYFRAWIDFNQDGDFDDPGEMVLEAIGTGPVSADVTIPPTAEKGPTRLRVSMRQGAFPEACEHFLIGEVQDYTVVVGDGSDGPQPAPDFVLIAPNPVSNQLNAEFHIHEEGEARLTILHGNGTVISSEIRFFAEGRHRMFWNVSSLQRGPYILYVQPEKQKAMAGKFVKME